MDLLGLGELQLDALREVANVGAGHAATALSQLTRRRVMLGVPEVRVARLEEVGELLGDPGVVVAAVIVRLEGAITGRTLQVMPGATAARLTALLLGTNEARFPDQFGVLERSALKEIGNILVGAYLNALGQFVRVPLQMSVPAIAIDMAGAVLTTSYLNFGDEEDHVFCVSTSMGFETGADLPAHFLLIPDANSLAEILRSLGMA
jgi:chemotaxis protein CheC